MKDETCAAILADGLPQRLTRMAKLLGMKSWDDISDIQLEIDDNRVVTVQMVTPWDTAFHRFRLPELH